MDLGKAGWLTTLLSEAVTAHDARAAATSPGLPERPGRPRARAYAKRVLRESGLLYGTPAEKADPNPATPPEVQLFSAVMRTFARIGLDIAEHVGAPAGPRREQLLVVFASLAHLPDLAAELARAIHSRAAAPVPRKSWQRVEDALEKRAMSLAGDPAYGLVLHNGAVYADARLFAHHAIDFFQRGDVRPDRVERLNAVSARQKALLVEVLTALTRVERPPSFPVRRAILRQIEDLQLPDELESELRGKVKRSFERAPPLPSLVRNVRSASLRRFILEQTLLASVVDGHRSQGELQFIKTLAAVLGVSEAELGQMELAMAEFYRKHRHVVDVFTVAAGAELMGEETLESITRTVEKNVGALMREIRETGELSVLLTRATMGQKLTADERKRMREQLIDIAKAVPALAIFAAPGGLLLLIALAKVLPFNLLPSSFQDPPEDDRGPRS